MVLTHGQSVGIRSSDDLHHWWLESIFGQEEGCHGEGPWECPDLFQLTAPDGTSRWVLIVGIAADAYGGGSGTQYFVGNFDGRCFVNDNAPETVLWADYGRDYYAAQSFSGAGEVITIAWVSNWQYARETPTQGFRGSLSLPRRLSLVETPDGIRLHQAVDPLVAQAFETVTTGMVPLEGTYRTRVRFELATFRPLAIALFGERSPHIVITPIGEKAARVRTSRRSIDGMPSFSHDYSVDVTGEAAIDIDIFVDNGLVEFSAGGLVWITNLYFPSDPAGRIQVIDLADTDQPTPTNAAS